MRDSLDNFESITFLNTKFKIVAEMLAKSLTQIEDLAMEALTCEILIRFIQDNFYLMRCIIEMVGCKPIIGGAFINFDQLKTFDNVDHQYLKRSSKQLALGSSSVVRSLQCTAASDRWSNLMATSRKSFEFLDRPVNNALYLPFSTY